MSAADAFALQNSMIREDTSPDFTSKQWSFMNDQNQSNYSTKQLVFDLSGFYNSQRFINLSEMVLVIPLVTVLSPDDLFGTSNSIVAGTYDGLGSDLTVGAINYPSQLFSVGFKSGYWNLIYSMSVNVDGQDVVQLTPNINYYCNFIANTKWSESDVRKHGPMCGFLPDDELSWGMNGSQVGDTNGYGVYNNSLPPQNTGATFIAPSALWTAAGGGSGSTNNAYLNIFNQNGVPPDLATSNTYVRAHVNQALYERMLKTSRYVNPLLNSGNAGTKQDPQCIINGSGVNGSDDFTRIALNDGCYVVNANDSNCNNSGRVWYTTAIIRFKDICQLFEKLPLTRSLYIRLLINLNIGHLSVYNPHTINNAAPATGDQKLFPYSTTVTSSDIATSANTSTGVISVTNAPFTSEATAIPAFIPAATPTIRTLDSSGFAATMVNMTTYTASTLPPKFGYGYIYDNTFQGTCPLMLAKCVSSFYTGSTRTPEAYGSGPGAAYVASAGQAIESDVLPGVNCGLYSQYRNALKLSIAVCKPDSSYHPRISSQLAGFSSGLQSTRIYAPSIELEPSKALMYLENHKEQEIRYNDVLALVYPGVAPTTNFNYFVANGIANAKRIIVMPFFHDDTQPTANAITVTSSWANVNGTAAPNYYNMSCSRCPFEPISPFDSAPSTTGPMAYIRNFNVLLSNANIFQRNLDYDFENFLEELSECNAINGGLDTGLTSGLIDFRKWQNNYRYYVANLSRRLAGDNTPKSITLQGINDTYYMMDLYIFVEYERKFSLNVETGHISM